MANRLHIMTAVQRAALDGDIDENTIYGKVRRLAEHPDTRVEIVPRKEIQSIAKQAIAAVGALYFPVERARMALDIREGELRADVLDAIAALDTSNPRDCRDIYELHAKVGGSIGEPTIREAIDMLSAAGQDVTALTARCDELFPKADDE